MQAWHCCRRGGGVEPEDAFFFLFFLGGSFEAGDEGSAEAALRIDSLSGRERQDADIFILVFVSQNAFVLSCVRLRLTAPLSGR